MTEGQIGIPVSLAMEIVDLGRRLVPYLDGIQAREAPSEADEEVAYVPGQGDWTRENLERLRRELRSGARALLDLAAEHPDEVVHYSAALERSGKSTNYLRADLAVMSAAARKLFGAKIWPLEAWQDSADGKMRYRMPAKIAEWWLGR